MTPDERAARERKQKIFVLVGGLLLLGLVAFQLPRLLGGSGSESAAPTETSTDVQVGTVGTPPPQGVPVALAGSGQDTSVARDKLRSFSTFKPKDPFVQKVTTKTEPAASPAPGVGVSKPDQGSFEVTDQPAAPMATVISVNGVSQSVEPGEKFPAGDPTFVLVAQQPKAKSVVIGVAGGAYSSGAKSTKLRVGKTLVLVNTATGAKYRLKLVSVGKTVSGASPAP